MDEFDNWVNIPFCKTVYFKKHNDSQKEFGIISLKQC